MIAAACAGGYVEQHLVSALGLRSYQLHKELGLCRFCGHRIMDWGICIDDSLAQAEGGGQSSG